MKTLAWHYTKGVHFSKIVESGWLKPSAVMVRPPERPVLWFSLNQHFEPTARMCAIENGSHRTLSLDETFTAGGGMIRFGLSPHGLLSGDRLRKNAHIDRQMWSRLCACGIEQGADPALWFGTTKGIDISLTVIEVRESATGAWIRVQGGAA